MKEEQDRTAYTCSPEYDRSARGDCLCATCYEQEFCDRCKDCHEQSRKKTSCFSYEGAYNY